MKVSTRWTSHLKTRDAKDKFKARLKANKDLFKVLDGILERDLESLLRRSESEDNYSLPAWKEYQADLIGARRQLRKIKQLINFEEA